MLRQLRLLLGISVFWLALSILLDGVNTLVLPLQISKLASPATQATVLGLLTFVGLVAAAFIQPLAGALSDRWKPVLGRKGFIGLGLLLNLASLLLFAIFDNLLGVMIGYLLIQLSASLAQAGQQGLIPDLIEKDRRGVASGLKGFMDMTGAMLGFVILGQLLGSDNTAVALGVIAAVLVSAYLLATLLTPEDQPAHDKSIPTGRISFSRLFRLDLIQHAAFKRILVARFLFLFGVYAIGRFLLFFVAERLGLDPNQAAEQAGMLLGALAFVTILASPVSGWLADRIGRVPLMVAGAILGAASALLMIRAYSAAHILLFGSLMSLGSAAFGSGSWALLADIVPRNESARYFGLANFSTAGPTAAAGLLGPAIDWFETVSPGNGYSLLFIVSAAAFAASMLPLRNGIRNSGVKSGNKREDRAHAAGLAVVPVSADPAPAEEDQDPPRGTSQL
jgi:MFS family permease